MKNCIFSIVALFFVISATAQNVGIGTTTPSEKLEVNGNVKVNNDLNVSGNTQLNGTLKVASGSPGAGKVLTSDGIGNASWDWLKLHPVVAKKLANQSISSGFGLTKITFGDYTHAPDETSLFSSDYYNVPRGGFYHFDVNISLLNPTGLPMDDVVRIYLIKESAGGGFTTIYKHTVGATGSTNMELGTVSFSTDLYIGFGKVGIAIENLTSHSITVEGADLSLPVATSFSAHALQ